MEGFIRQFLSILFEKYIALPCQSTIAAICRQLYDGIARYAGCFETLPPA
jgi:hypothetical protein